MTETADVLSEAYEDEVDAHELSKLTKQLKQHAASLGREEARHLVDAYYQMQDFRKAAANQVRSAECPVPVTEWLCGNVATLERNVRLLLKYYAEGDTVGRWAMSIVGIGPVIAAGLLAHIDITKAPVAGSIWKFAGLDPSAQWEKGQIRPWNADLKVLCWKAGECFVKVSNHEDDYYGHAYAERKAYETERNERGDLADQAASKLAKFSIGKDTDAWAAYSQGKLPPAHIHERAKRWAVKLFLSHWHEVAYETHYGEKPPKPYAIAHAGHAHRLEVPNWPLA